MLRIIYDEHGSGSQDLFVKIDGSVSRTLVADTSWLGFFFDREEDGVEEDLVTLTEDELILARKADVALLIQFWQETLLSEQTVCYLPYCLYDQGGQVLRITKKKKLYNITPVWSDDLIETTPQSYFLRYQESAIWQPNGQDYEWNMAPSSILTGLAWSLAKLEQPIVPLRYD